MKINEGTTKCVLIVDSTLPVGKQANVAAILAMTIGNKIDGIIGHNVYDREHVLHQGITQLNIPILAASMKQIQIIKDAVCSNEDIYMVDFTETAQKSKSYVEYVSKLSDETSATLRYIGLGLVGEKKSINKLTGNLKLLR